MINKIHFLLVVGVLAATFVSAQKKANSYRDMPWKEIATKMPDDWYGGSESVMVADSVLKYQTAIGGWSKNYNWQNGMDGTEWAMMQESGIGATFDNDATITEMMFLTKMFSKTQDPRYLESFQKAFNYILEAQYKNGGWPQFYPFRQGKTIAYNSHITYNDDAMVHVMQFLKDIADEKKFYAPMQVSADLRQKAKQSFEQGVACVLATQIRVKEKPTVWCAQHDEFTLAPANARAYELASFSGQESVGIALLLMEIDHPSKEIINAVKGAKAWFESHRIEGIVLEIFINSDGQKDKRVVEDKNAPTLWARFYDLDTEQPYFCDRDGIKRKTFTELGYNRRNGYGWYTAAPQKFLKAYPAWAKKWGIGD